MSWRQLRSVLSSGTSRLVFLERFSTVLEHCLRLELPVPDGLRRAAQQDGWRGYRDVVAAVAERCDRGDILSDALRRTPRRSAPAVA